MEKNNKKQVQPVTPQELKEFFAGDSKEIIKILDLVEKRDELVEEIKMSSNEGKKLEKALEDKYKDAEKEEKDAINNALDIELKEENKEIDEINAKIKSIKSKRDKAKEKGIKRRIEDETNDYVETNKKLRTKIRKDLKSNDLPTYCDSDWFYVMYYTNGFKQLLIKWFVFFMGFFGLPYIIVKIVNPWFLLKGVLWLIVAAIFFGVYITIYLVTKDKDNGIIEELRESREKYADNKKKINEIKRSIRKDEDEESYGLEKYDKELEELERRLKIVTDKKNFKISEFKENSQEQISEEIKNKYSGDIETIKIQISNKVDICKEKTLELNEVEEILRTNYEKYIAKPYLNVGCIRRMLELVEGGNAKDIGEAFEIVK